MNMKPLIAVCLCLCLSAQLGAQAIFVKAGENGDGKTWQTATGDLQQALASATAGTEIWIAAGTYYPTTCTTCTPQDRYVAFEIPDGVKLYGGFQGWEANLEERNWQEQLTIFSGDIDQDGELNNNSHHIIYTFNVGPGTLVDGLIIEEGFASDTLAPWGGRGNSGAGWLNIGSLNGRISNPQIQNCLFRKNQALGFGGALYNNGDFQGESNPEISNCQFLDNRAEQGGGAVYNNGSLSGLSKAVFTDCRFERNFTPLSGGAVYNNGQDGNASPVFMNSIFIDNQTTQYGGAIYNLGKNGQSSPSLTNCIFSNNTAYAAGAMYNLGSSYGNSSPRIVNCTFYHNLAEVGACVYNQAGDTTGTCNTEVYNCIFWDNDAPFGKVFQNSYGNLSINYSLVQLSSCEELNNGINGTISCGEHLFYETDPLFQDAKTHNLHLNQTSPAIDHGNNQIVETMGITIDLDRLIRVWNGTVDLGAYEYNSNGYVAPMITRQPVSTQEVCEGASAEIEISLFGTRPLQFQWYKDGQLLSGDTTETIQLANTSLSQEGTYRCLVISLLNDSIWSDPSVLNVQPTIEAAISIASSTADICKGMPIDFTAVVRNEGATPTYAWRINGVDKQIGDSATFSSIALEDGDKVSCFLTASAQCLADETIVSNEVTVAVQDVVLPTIELAASATKLCQGKEVVFRATIEHGGNEPSFLWRHNNETIVNSDDTFSLSNPANGDQLRCILVSDARCAMPDTIWSELVELEVQEYLQASLQIKAGSIICPTDTNRFVIDELLNEGNAPRFQWFVNGVKSAENGTELNLNTIEEGDEIRCLMWPDGECLLEDSVFSNRIEVVFDPACTTTAINDPIDTSAIVIYPNPTHNGQFRIKGVDKATQIRLYDTKGSLIGQPVSAPLNGAFELDLSDQQNGLFWIKIVKNQQIINRSILYMQQ